MLQDTRTPLTTWFRAIWWVSSQRTGASAVGLQEVLGLGSYETAWTWLHKLRRAMVRPGRDQLSGVVEVDETYLGATEEGVHGRETVTKALIAVAAEERGRGIGRIRLRRIADLSAHSLASFVQEAVAAGSVVHTDGWRGYRGLEARGYHHQVTVLRTRTDSPAELLPRVHRVVSLLKRWVLGTHQGAISHAHLDAYLDEFTFRSIGDARGIVASCSTGCSSRPWPSTRHPIASWSRASPGRTAATTTCRGYLSEGDTQIPEYPGLKLGSCR